MRRNGNPLLPDLGLPAPWADDVSAWNPPIAKILDELEAQRARRAAQPPAPGRPVLVTVGGELVAVREDFTVIVSPSDPNWKPGVPGWCFFRARAQR